MLLTHLIYTGILSLFVSLPSAAPQALTYDVIVHNRPVGQLNVSKASTETGIHYRVDADVSVHLLGEKRMVTRFTSTYRNNVLVEASFTDKLNGRTRHDAQIRWNGSSYVIRINDAHSTLTDRRATYSTASLYDREPVGVRELFSERYGQFCALKTTADHTYELTLPDGKKNYYRYVNGRCHEVEVQQPLFTVFFRLRHD
ncbi:DUF6134 family protein [Spirosoma sp.]|uniref:DUF6134 family protein n=1 Tax=Spirosoma sp. TaxID=1899569 RepID=UPI003B3A88E7